MFVHRPDARLFSLRFGQGPLTLLALGGWVGSGEVWHDHFGHRCRSALQVQDRLAALRLPALVVQGTADAASPPADARRLAAGLADAELQLLDGLGHVPGLSAPTTVARLIDIRFMRAMPAAA